MNKKLAILCAAIVLVSSIPLIVSAQPGGFSSWISLKRSGTDNSYMIIDSSGTATNRYKIDTTASVASAPTGLTLTM